MADRKTEHISFPSTALDDWRYVRKLADREHEGNFSAAIRAIIRSERTRKRPVWADGLVNEIRGLLGNIQVVTGGPDDNSSEVGIEMEEGFLD